MDRDSSKCLGFMKRSPCAEKPAWKATCIDGQIQFWCDKHAELLRKISHTAVKWEQIKET